MWAIYALSIYVVPLVVLGIINLYVMPARHVTVAGVLLFAAGGLVGMTALINLAVLGLRPLMGFLGFQGEFRYGALVGYAILCLGVEIGGLAALSLTRRFRKNSMPH
jgi:hypothetical protein